VRPRHGPEAARSPVRAGPRRERKRARGPGNSRRFRESATRSGPGCAREPRAIPARARLAEKSSSSSYSRLRARAPQRRRAKRAHRVTLDSGALVRALRHERHSGQQSHDDEDEKDCEIDQACFRHLVTSSPRVRSGRLGVRRPPGGTASPRCGRRRVGPRDLPARSTRRRGGFLKTSGRTPLRRR